MIEKAIKYDRHALRRMKWRRISQVEIEQTLHDPEKTEFTREGRKNAYKAIGDRYIKVTYRELGDEILIISAVDKSG